jgi:CYTH domain-containing protein
LTVKRGAGDSRTEREVTLTRRQFDALWALTADRRIEKVRYNVPAGSNYIEVDVYGGKLRGLVTAEVEFSSEREIRRFVQPPWLGREVTGQSRFSNTKLAAAPGRPRGAAPARA